MQIVPAEAKKQMDKYQEIFEYLKKSRLFGRLPENILKELASLSDLIQISKGTEILQAGQINQNVYLLIEGQASVFVDGEWVISLKAGDIVGEMSVISAQPCSASVIAATDVELFCIHARDINQFSSLDSDDLQNALYRIFAAVLTDKLAHTSQKAKRFEATNRELEEIKSQLEQQLERRKEQFKLFVPKEFMERIQMGGEELEETTFPVRPIQEEATILFSDIRFFSTFSEKMSTAETFDFLNDYLAVMEPCITRNSGFIDKFIGDAIMAIFQSPEDAVQAALDMDKSIEQYNLKRLENKQYPINLGIGINTGLVTVGLLGTSARLESTVIGDAVNLASRLEGLTKEYSCRIIISENTYNKLPQQPHIRQIDRVIVRGRETPLNIYEVFGSDVPEQFRQKMEGQEFFSKGMQLYIEQSFEEALQCFQRYYEICPRDLIGRIYMSRCSYLLENPPCGKWEGIFQKRSKRYSVENIPARLFFESSPLAEKHVEILMKNVSQSGVLITMEPENELYAGECVMLEMDSLPWMVESAFPQEPLRFSCQVKRRQPGFVSDQVPALEFGLHFTDIAPEQAHVFRHALTQFNV
ncbi:MAG: cyclic nucleotide-binding domain-containing protein [SAR324 cluster bacterium]|nr:cyclic nucleotide-binding domain-containing protein [SAR324 cluster bacterium]